MTFVTQHYCGCQLLTFNNIDFTKQFYCNALDLLYSNHTSIYALVTFRLRSMFNKDLQLKSATPPQQNMVNKAGFKKN
jgi:hypothetical protein